MIHQKEFAYKPQEFETEKASNSYLMSLMALAVGLPFPIVNLLATFIFYASNKRGTYYVRWHCTQALLSQAGLFIVNSIGFWWTLSILFGQKGITNEYIAWILIVFLVNLTEFIFTVILAVQTRKRKHYEIFFFGDVTHLLCKPYV